MARSRQIICPTSVRSKATILHNSLREISPTEFPGVGSIETAWPDLAFACRSISSEGEHDIAAEAMEQLAHEWLPCLREHV